MNIRITGRHIEVTPQVRSVIEKKVKKLARYFEKIHEISVVLDRVKYRHVVEMVVKAGHITVQSTEENSDLLVTFDRVLSKVQRQLKKQKQKLIGNKKHLKKSAKARQPTPGEAPEPEPDSLAPPVVLETASLKPMALRDATLQIETLAQQVLLFLNEETLQPNVLYRRPNGQLALIQPQESPDT
jgi:putative sigma-54 modulation protein